MQVGQELEFKFSGLMQTASIKFICKLEENIKTIACEAKVKLPILKKSYHLCTHYEGDSMNWISHVPPHESGEGTKKLTKTPELQNVLDPISFFMALHESDWTSSTVDVLLGARVVTLAVHPTADGYQIQRRDKNQKLIVRKDANGLSSIEIPVPVVGNLSLKRI